ncbi:MAG: ribonuclease P protein component [Microcystaceae cyanobacterium]
MGLPKANRLKNHRNFHQVYQQGKAYKSSHLVLRALYGGLGSFDSSQLPTRFGITISRKVSKKAVIRNRLKRQIRSGIRTLLPQVLPGWRVIIIVRRCAIECKYEHFLRELKKLLIEAEIIYGH